MKSDVVSISDSDHSLTANLRTRNRPRPELVWDKEEYPRWEEGVYDYLLCTEARSYWCPLFKRWTLRLAFIDGSGQTEGTTYSFVNLGSGKTPGRNSRFYREWVIANGDQPKRGDRMSPRAFQGKMFRGKVRLVTKNFDGDTHDEAMKYSVVEKILERRAP
jgi:hypothetical protein